MRLLCFLSTLSVGQTVSDIEIKDLSAFGTAISLVPKQSAWPKLFINLGTE